MYRITKIIEEKIVAKYIEKRSLVNQYKKAKNDILNLKISWNFLQKRKPKKSWIYYFRINKQFRALCFIDWSALKVFEIDNHS